MTGGITGGMTARVLAAQVRAGALEPLAAADEALARAKASQPVLNAFSALDPSRTIAEAARVKARLEAGDALPLAGVPLIVKDNIFTQGWRIAQGSRLFEAHIAAEDALAVARARAAGAVVIGIGACSEFACKGVTTTPLNGVTHHPLDASLTPGGSSGGNAAALAAGVAPLALGTDAGGSSRRPPAHCGIVGFKPSQGAVAHPIGFSEPFWGLSCISPMARDVADAALLFDVIAGPDAQDPESHVIAPSARTPVSALRIAVSPDLGLDAPVDADVREAFARTVDALARAGFTLVEAAPVWPSPHERARLAALQFAGLAAIHGEAARAAPDMIDPDIMAQIERGFALTGADVAAALEASLCVRRALADFFTRHDALISLTTPCLAWPHAQLGPTRIGGREVDPRGHAVLTPLYNHGHNPAISIPCGRGARGLPVGLQIGAAAGQDRLVLALAQAAETILAEAGLWSPT